MTKLQYWFLIYLISIGFQSITISFDIILAIISSISIVIAFYYFFENNVFNSRN